MKHDILKNGNLLMRLVRECVQDLLVYGLDDCKVNSFLAMPLWLTKNIHHAPPPIYVTVAQYPIGINVLERATGSTLYS